MNKNTIGLAFRAKKVCVGTEITIEKIRKNQVFLVILASDASDLTKKKIMDKTSYYKVEVLSDIDTLDLSNSVGKKNIKVVGILDRGLAESIRK